MIVISGILLKKEGAYKRLTRGSKGTYIFFYLLCLIAILFSIYSTVDAKIKIDKIITFSDDKTDSFINEEAFLRINLEELDNIYDKNTGIIYVRRTDCYICKEVKPVLENFLIEKDIKAYYYDTSWDREKNKVYLENVLKKYNIEYVPTIFIIEKDNIVALFEGESIVEKLEDHLMKK